MKKIYAAFVSIFLVACGYSGQAAVNTQPGLAPPSPTPTPSPTADTQMCAFMWAYQDLPEISREVQAAIQQIYPAAQAQAQAYGENCVYADGHATFSAMETDFYVTVRAKNLDDPEELGGVIVQTMQVLEQFPRGKVPGGQDGFVVFRFDSADKNVVIRVPIDEYGKLPPGTSKVEVYRKFENQSP